MVYVVILAYFAVLLFIGAVTSLGVRDLADYYVGGKLLAIGSWRSRLARAENPRGSI